MYKLAATVKNGFKSRCGFINGYYLLNQVLLLLSTSAIKKLPSSTFVIFFELLKGMVTVLFPLSQTAMLR
jgi:hypothetical protein